MPCTDDLGLWGCRDANAGAGAHLQGRERDITFVAINGGGAAEVELRALGFDVLCLGAKPSVYSVGTLINLTATLRRLRPDVVHAHGAEANFTR